MLGPGFKLGTSTASSVIYALVHSRSAFADGRENKIYGLRVKFLLNAEENSAISDPGLSLTWAKIIKNLSQL